MYQTLKKLEHGFPLSPVLVEEPGPTASKPDAVGEQGSSQHDQILRFQASERMLHWSIAVPFMICYATGMVLMLFFNLHSAGASREILSWTHRLAGTAMILFPTLTVVRYWREYRVHFHNIRHAWSWAAGDIKWLALMIPAFVSRSISLPEQGKFNAAEKVNFLMVLCTYPLFIATGLLIWIPESGVLFWMVHVGMALIATPLMLGHIFMALVNPETRVGLSGMITGYVDRHWARHHYCLWYKENFGADEKRAEEGKEASRPDPQDAIVVLRFVTRRPSGSDRPAGISLRPVPAEQEDGGAVRGGSC